MFVQGLCQACSKQPKKYTCPRCTRRICSLACSLSHKIAFSCSGQIDRLSHLKSTAENEEGEVENKRVSPDDLLKDARFLEHVANSLENTVNNNVGVQEGKKKAQRPFMSRKQRELVKVVKRVYSSTLLLFLPPTFSKAKQNKTYAHTKTHVIHWTIEVKHDGILKLLHSVPDTRSVSELCDCNSLHTVHVYDEAPGARKSGWIPLPNFDNMSVKEALQGIGIVEFPKFRFCEVKTLDLDEK